MAASTAGAAGSQNTERDNEIRLAPNHGAAGGPPGVAPQGAPQVFASLLSQLPSNANHNMDRFLVHRQLSGGQYERPPLGFTTTETKSEVEARVQAQLNDFTKRFKSSNNSPHS